MSCSFMLILTSLRNLSTFNKKWLLFAIKIIKYYIHTHTHFSYIERQIHNCGWGSPDYPERTDEHSENMLHTERLLLVGLNPGSSWCETKPNKTKNNNKKGQSLLHLVQFKHVESFLITYRQEAFKCSYSNRK